MKLAMVMPTEGNSVFIADFTPHGRLLRELEVMRIGRLTAAGEARLGANEFQVLAITAAQRFAEHDCRADGSSLWHVFGELVWVRDVMCHRWARTGSVHAPPTDGASPEQLSLSLSTALISFAMPPGALLESVASTPLSTLRAKAASTS